MKIEQLIKMANQIGSFFSAMPDREEALDGVANHIRNFWEPRMRKALIEFIDANPEGATTKIGLDEISLSAIKKHRDRLLPQQPS